MSRWTSDTKSRASKKAIELHEKLRRELKEAPSRTEELSNPPWWTEDRAQNILALSAPWWTL